MEIKIFTLLRIKVIGGHGFGLALSGSLSRPSRCSPREATQLMARPFERA